MSESFLNRMAKDIIQGRRSGLEPNEAQEILCFSQDQFFELLFTSREVCAAMTSGSMRTCLICNAKSGQCSQDCAFCAQSMHHAAQVPTYPLLAAEHMLKQAVRAQEAGATHFSLVTSGKQVNRRELDVLIEAVDKICQKTDLAVCASLGLLSQPMAQELAQSGVVRFHHNLETAESYFPQVCSTHAYVEDIWTVEAARRAGMQVCCGGIIGLGESWEQRLELAFALRSLDVDSIPLNFLNPIPGTRLADRPFVRPLEALKCIALFRLINPSTDIIICGGREVTLKDFQSWIFLAGANGLMLGNYLTTQGRSAAADMEMIQEQAII
ncbi:MAG: biotin synthase BioB [Thermodesulfobacteriota bacterium]